MPQRRMAPYAADVFSRKIVAWQIFAEESSEHASNIMQDLCWREHIRSNQVTLHSDNGSPMKGATLFATLKALGVMASLRTPSVSNDNPYSGAGHIGTGVAKHNAPSLTQF